MIITLPWPDAVLFPNAAMRDGAKFARREAAREYRELASLTARDAVKGDPDLFPERLICAIGVDFYPPNNKRDLDGMLSAIKFGIDGLFQYIGQNDRQVTEITLIKHPADKDNPRVVISLIEKE